MTNQELVQAILSKVGGKEKVLAVTNCMTRLRIDLADESKLDVSGLKAIEGVLGVVHDRNNFVEVVLGPGKVRKCADICASMGIAANKEVMGSWQENKQAMKDAQKQSRVKTLLKSVGDIFVPLIPGVLAAGLCAGLATLIAQLNPNFAENAWLSILHSLLTLINQAFLAYLTAWAGYRAAEKFGGTPILGGMLGMITGLGGINTISETITNQFGIALFDSEVALNSILRSGRGGVLAVIIGVYFLVKIERWIRSKMPDSLDVVFTPLCTMFLTLIPYIFIVMPLTGFLSSIIVDGVGAISMSENIFVRMIAGFISAALFLPMVAMGMHHGLVALYTVQLNAMGYVTLYPALCMAGAGQVGAAIAIYLKAKKLKKDKLCNVIKGALPAGILGVGEPLIYGVTLPMGKPFMTAGLGAGFGGAFVMAMQSAATAWGPSGVLGMFVMTAGPNDAVMSVLYYLIAILISYLMGFIITQAVIKEDEVASV